ncbi:hypothetical protein HELRODRAFT_174682 [Helobdella robusta]|uniref:Fibrinogen C-terminal domain-containing protein n=1 Tax=Helobdella robusta TaxID=6412 RepID=T1F8D2_HELRO|nr:hypothetical protein HELRODRAFT_174682 [Helobdella robusta]ESO01710.1 hypothetical protein HELRODRAFT_174682 [Helobdella robusta]
MCFASEPATVLTNIRSSLECSSKCSHYVSPTDGNITCNAFNYVSNNATRKSCNFPFTFNGGLFYSCSNSLPGVNNSCGLYMCLTGNRQLSVCLDPLAYTAVNQTVSLNITSFADSTPVTSVNGWIAIPQRIDGSLSFNKLRNSGFGIYDGNYWLGLEKMHMLTTSADYRLRFEVLVNGVWTSDENDHFVTSHTLNLHRIGQNTVQSNPAAAQQDKAPLTIRLSR